MTAEYKVHGDVAVITLNNPPVNGLGHETRIGITNALAQANADAAVKAVVLVVNALVPGFVVGWLAGSVAAGLLRRRNRQDRQGAHREAPAVPHPRAHPSIIPAIHHLAAALTGNPQPAPSPGSQGTDRLNT